ncbi:sensor histidine kinase [Aureitalea sp. L0-47]|uniref:tetratricopeptide repeat-containing sensor histidine kinase n=1 Tax=Aureitalea sp. L0-47 TaxID=2816962 RepID=UPI002237B9DB|nr:sensor histidine kinase [Aureitalea sp. L0-47]MCW5520939.1 sensor histidine kinase [Aureitalea sp. L0-47]
MLSTNQLFVFFIAFAALLTKPQYAFSQENEKQRIDSIISSLKGKDSEARESSYFAINKLIMKSGGENSESLFRYALSKDSSDQAKMVFYESMSIVFSRRGNTNEALKIKKRGLELAEKLNEEHFILVYNNDIGNLYIYQNLPDKALFHINKAQVLAEKEEFEHYNAGIYYNRGLLENLLENVEGQHYNYLKMWQYASEFKNNPTKRFYLYVLVDFLSQTDYPEELAKYTEELSALYEEANPNTPEGHMPIKAIFEKRSDPSNIPSLIKSIRISDSLNSVNSLTFSSIALAKTYEKMGRPFEGISVLKKAIQKIESTDKPQLKLDLYSEVSRISAQASEYQEAFNFLRKETAMRDSIKSERMQHNIAELEVKFDTEQKERKIAQQNLVIEKEERQKNQVLIGLAALGILLIITSIFFRNRLKYQRTIAKQKEAIQQQQIVELQQQNKLLALNSMIEGQEAERLRIAKDLHDSLGGLLSTVKAHFSAIQKEIEQLEKLNITEKTNSLIDEACIEVRRISHNMMPHALSISGLGGAVEDLSTNLREEGYEVTLELKDLPKMENTREVVVYRLLQEIISNIRKHAEANTILIQLLPIENGLNILIEDNGKGFDYEQALSKGGLGLKSINSRVQFLDGQIDWDSELGRGTSITIEIPNQ